MANSDYEPDFLFPSWESSGADNVIEKICSSCVSKVADQSRPFALMFRKDALAKSTFSDFLSFLSRCDNTLDAFARLAGRAESGNERSAQCLRQLCESIISACVWKTLLSVEAEPGGSPADRDDSRSENSQTDGDVTEEENDARSFSRKLTVDGDLDLCFHRMAVLFLKCAKRLNAREKKETFDRFVTREKEEKGTVVFDPALYFACHVCKISSATPESIAFIPADFIDALFRRFLLLLREFELNAESTKIVVAAATSILPLALEVEKSEERILSFWSAVLAVSASRDGHPRFGLKNEIAFSVACTVFDRLLASSLVETAEFWNFLRLGLTHANSGTRKRARFLFATALDRFAKSERSVVNVIDRSFYLPASKSGDRSGWLRLWNTVSILFETLEEKQVHVIKPVLPRFTDDVLKFCDGNDDDIDVAWVCAILTRALAHESRAISRWGIVTTLRLASEARVKRKLIRPASSTDALLLSHLLTALNYEHVFSRWGCDDETLETFAPGDRPPVAQALGEFIFRITSMEEGVDVFSASPASSSSSSPEEGGASLPLSASFFLRFLTAVKGVQWNQISMVYVIEALSQVSVIKCFSDELVDLLKELLSQNVAFMRCGEKRG